MNTDGNNSGYWTSIITDNLPDTEPSFVEEVPDTE
jgi:hypothetical protein